MSLGEGRAFLGLVVVFRFHLSFSFFVYCRHMAVPTINAGGVGVTSTQHHEAKHKQWAHAAYSAAGKGFVGLHSRMGMHLQRHASIESIPEDSTPRRRHRRAGVQQGTGADCLTKMVGKNSRVVLWQQGQRVNQACVCLCHHALCTVFIYCFCFCLSFFVFRLLVCFSLVGP